jgi:cytochrome c
MRREERRLPSAGAPLPCDRPGRGGSVPQGPPTFPQVARSGLTADQLRAFLSHPHGAMPDLSLTRAEIDDLVAYIATLR